MKQWLNKKVSFLVLGVLSAFYLLAQEEKKVDVDISLDKGDNSNWYQQPWVWIVGGAVFILLLIAILKGSGSKRE